MKNEYIPAAAYFEAQILHIASAEGVLNHIVRSVEKECGIPQGLFGSGVFLETRVISLLYSLIVVPKELWKLGKDNPIYSEIDKVWSLEKVTISKDISTYKVPIYKFIHHLRNAIAHANFKFESGNFEFWDQDKQQPERYRAVLTVPAMQEFLEVVGSLLKNIPWRG